MIRKVPRGRLVVSWQKPVDLRGRAHPSWTRIVRAFHLVGMCQDMAEGALLGIIGTAAEVPADPVSVQGLLNRYYSGDGHSEVGVLRMRNDRIFMHRPGDDPSGTRFLAQIMLACPELGWIRFETHGDVVSLVATDVCVGLKTADDEVVGAEGEAYVRRTVSARGVVAAVNVLLSQIHVGRRFVPLCGAEGVEAYVAVTQEQAQALAAVDALASSLERLVGFAGWQACADGQAQRARTRRSFPGRPSRVWHRRVPRVG